MRVLTPKVCQPGSDNPVGGEERRVKQKKLTPVAANVRVMKVLEFIKRIGHTEKGKKLLSNRSARQAASSF
jgi:hypothetical protein